MSSKSGNTNKPGKKVLRIGLIQNGKILEERVFRVAANVRVGTDLSKNDLVVPASDLPKSFQLFDISGGGYALCFTSKMSGRVSTGDGVLTLKELVSQGKAKKTDSGFRLELSPRARGKVQLGEVTILFQFVTPPPPVARPVLPASMRGGWFKNVDYHLIAMIALSALLQIGFVIFLQAQEWPEQLDGLDQQIPDRFVELMKAPEPEVPDIPDKAEVVDEGEGEPDDTKEAKAEEPTPQPRPEPQPDKTPEVEKPAPTAEELAEARAAEKKRMEEEVRNSTLLGKLGSKSGDGPSIVDSLAGGAANVAIDTAFDGSRGVKDGIAGYEKSGLRSGGSSDADGSGAAAGISDLGASSGAKKAEKGVDTGSKSEEKVTARVKVEDGGQVVGSGKLDANSISRTVKQNASSIQRCFERVLKTDPSAGGKLVLTVTIGRAGRATSVKANTSIGGGFKSCAETAVKSWRFERPQGGDVMFNKTFVLQASK